MYFNWLWVICKQKEWIDVNSCISRCTTVLCSKETQFLGNQRKPSCLWCQQWQEMYHRKITELIFFFYEVSVEWGQLITTMLSVTDLAVLSLNAMHFLLTGETMFCFIWQIVFHLQKWSFPRPSSNGAIIWIVYSNRKTSVDKFKVSVTPLELSSSGILRWLVTFYP